jgi:glutathione S-transferase
VPGDAAPAPNTLYVCHLDEGSIPAHACRRAAKALRDHGHQFEKVIHGRGRPFGVSTTGRRPRLKEISGQEKLPVLVLADGTVINGSGRIIEWARAHAS